MAEPLTVVTPVFCSCATSFANAASLLGNELGQGPCSGCATAYACSSSYFTNATYSVDMEDRATRAAWAGVSPGAAPAAI